MAATSTQNREGLDAQTTLTLIKEFGPSVWHVRGKLAEHVLVAHSPDSEAAINEELARRALEEKPRLNGSYVNGGLADGRGFTLTEVGFNTTSLFDAVNNVASLEMTGQKGYRAMLAGVAARVAATLDSYHAKGVYHGLVNPQTIFVGFDDFNQSTSVHRRWLPGFVGERLDPFTLFAQAASDGRVGTDGLDELATALVGSHMRVTLVDLSGVTLLDVLADKGKLPVNNEPSYIDPWLIATRGRVDDYGFPPDFPRVRAAAALQAADYWALGITMYEAATATTPWLASDNIPVPEFVTADAREAFLSARDVARTTNEVPLAQMIDVANGLAQIKDGGLALPVDMGDASGALETLLRFNLGDRLVLKDGLTPLGVLAKMVK